MRAVDRHRKNGRILKRLLQLRDTSDLNILTFVRRSLAHEIPVRGSISVGLTFFSKNLLPCSVIICSMAPAITGYMAVKLRRFILPSSPGTSCTPGVKELSNL